MSTNFRTLVEVPKSKLKISIEDSILSLGSCFSDEIGKRLSENKFDIITNPLGTIFNPIPIFNTISNTLENKSPLKNTYIKKEGIYFNEAFHSSIHSDSKEELEASILKIFNNLRIKIKHSNLLIFTFGTSIYYKNKSTNNIVGNCHKLPKENFERDFLEPSLISNKFSEIWSKIKKINPSIKALITISPVRHVKDNFIENNLSKSNLVIASSKIVDQNSDIFYFPAYEILLDDLRDYRFYKKDLIHPNDIAIDYIWEIFKESYFDLKTKDFLTEWEKIKLSIKHKSFFPKSKEYIKFIKNTINRINLLSVNLKRKKEKGPIITFSKELNMLHSLIEQ